jgi:hypothetical protein
VPFGAIYAGRQRLVWRELPVKALAIGLAVAIAIRMVHERIFAYGGAVLIALVVGGAFVTGFQARREAARAGLVP